MFAPSVGKPESLTRSPHSSERLAYPFGGLCLCGRCAFQSVDAPPRSVGLRVSGAVAPSAPPPDGRGSLPQRGRNRFRRHACRLPNPGARSIIHAKTCVLFTGEAHFHSLRSSDVARHTQQNRCDLSDSRLEMALRCTPPFLKPSRSIFCCALIVRESFRCPIIAAMTRCSGWSRARGQSFRSMA